MRTGSAQVHRVAVDDASLFVEVVGTGEPALVFAHGGTGSHQHWWQQVPVFAPRHRCITYDARGFGHSTGTPHVDGPDGHIADLVAVLDATGVTQAILVGHSMGGYAVSGVARRHAERVVGLVMVDTPFGIATEALSRWAVGMMDALASGFDVVAACAAPGFADARPDLAFLLDSITRQNPPRPPVRGRSAYEQMRDTPPADWSDHRVPTLFVVGEHDALTVPPLIAATAAAVPGSQLVTIPDAGHSPHFEQASAFNAVLAEFVATCGDGLSS